MQKYVNDIATVVGGSLAPLASASCAVYLTGTTTLASLYSDNGVTALTNPTTSSATGRLQFYAADGRYDIVCSKSGYTTTTITDVLLEDPAQGQDLYYLPAGTGAVSRTVQGKLQETVSVTDFGAVGNGVTDDAAAIQAAINYVVSAGGGRVYFNEGVYLIGSALIATKGVVLDGKSRTDVSSNTNGGGVLTARPTIYWGGTAGGYMYTVRPATVGDCVWGGGSVDIEWNGGDSAAVAVHLNNTKYAVFDGKVRQVTFAGVLVNSQSGSVTNFSMKNHVRSLEFVYGVAAACQNAHGLSLGGNASTVPATQQYVGDVSGLVYNGALVNIAETDNAQFQSVHASVEAGGTGCAVNIVNAGAQAANNNVFVYVDGPIKLDNGLIGNAFLNYNSEAGGITQLAGSSAWDGDLTDYVTGRRFVSHKYELRKKISIPSASMAGDAQTGFADFGAQWRSITLLAAQPAPTVHCFLPEDYDLADGTVEGVEITFGSNGTSAGNYRLTLNYINRTAGNGFTTPQQTIAATVAAGAQYVATTYTFSFSQAFSKGSLIGLKVTRSSGDALDTNSDDMHILGIRVLYKSTGPNSSGSGSYYIPAWS
jgi:hypothetical protein